MSDPRETRDRLLDAAERLLGRLGYSKTTLDDLAEEAGIGRRTIYLHFPSKEEVFMASIDRVVERVIVELEGLAAMDAPAKGRIRAMLVARILVRFDSVRGYWRSLAEMLTALRSKYLERREASFAREAALFARVVGDGVERGELATVDPRATGRSLVLATNAFLLYALSERELGSRAAVAREVERIADLVLEGLARRDAGTARKTKKKAGALGRR